MEKRGEGEKEGQVRLFIFILFAICFSNSIAITTLLPQWVIQLTCDSRHENPGGATCDSATVVDRADDWLMWVSTAGNAAAFLTVNMSAFAADRVVGRRFVLTCVACAMLLDAVASGTL